MNQCNDPVPEMKGKKISVAVPVKVETTQLSIQHVLLVRVRTTRQIWRNLGGHFPSPGAEARPTKQNNNKNALQRQHKPKPVTRHF